jgi:hypothetical protein
VVYFTTLSIYRLYTFEWYDYWCNWKDSDWSDRGLTVIKSRCMRTGIEENQITSDRLAGIPAGNRYEHLSSISLKRCQTNLLCCSCYYFNLCCADIITKVGLTDSFYHTFVWYNLKVSQRRHVSLVACRNEYGHSRYRISHVQLQWFNIYRHQNMLFYTNKKLPPNLVCAFEALLYYIILGNLICGASAALASYIRDSSMLIYQL